jgi:hypothetical protein
MKAAATVVTRYGRPVAERPWRIGRCVFPNLELEFQTEEDAASFARRVGNSVGRLIHALGELEVQDTIPPH